MFRPSTIISPASRSNRSPPAISLSCPSRMLILSPKLPEPEFSRPFIADRLGAGVIAETLLASPAECTALTKRLGLVELGQLSATVTLERTLGGLIHVSGRFAADVVQICVVTIVALP